MDLFYFILFSFPRDIGLVLSGRSGGDKHPEHPTERGRRWQTWQWVPGKVPKLMPRLAGAGPLAFTNLSQLQTHIAARGDRAERHLGEIG